MVATDLLDGLESSHRVVFIGAPVFSCFQFILHGLCALPNDESVGLGLVDVVPLNVLVMLVQLQFQLASLSCCCVHWQ